MRPGARPSTGRQKGFRHPRAAARSAPKVRPDHEGPLHVELISIGRELLKGRTQDTNGPALAGYFTERGALVHRITIVDDTERAISSSIGEALGRHPHLVITSGGLGPASDDRTLAAVGDALSLPFSIQPRARQMIEDGYRRLRGKRLHVKGGLTAAREKMCSIPLGSELIPNEVGIVPGALIRLPGGAAVLCLPGAPEEMWSVFEAAIPLLKDLAPKGHRAIREIEAPTVDESSLRPLLDRLCDEYPMVWIKSYSPGPETRGARILVTLEASSATSEEAEATLDQAVKRLLALAAGVR